MFVFWLCWVLVTAHRIFYCDIQGLVPGPGTQPGSPALGAQSLNRWTTGKAPTNSFKVPLMYPSVETVAAKKRVLAVIDLDFKQGL